MEERVFGVSGEGSERVYVCVTNTVRDLFGPLAVLDYETLVLYFEATAPCTLALAAAATSTELICPPCRSVSASRHDPEPCRCVTSCCCIIAWGISCLLPWGLRQTHPSDSRSCLPEMLYVLSRPCQKVNILGVVVGLLVICTPTKQARPSLIPLLSIGLSLRGAGGEPLWPPPPPSRALFAFCTLLGTAQSVLLIFPVLSDLKGNAGGVPSHPDGPVV